MRPNAIQSPMHVIASIAEPKVDATLELALPHSMNADLLHEVVNFLDSQNRSHPFQFPQWARTEENQFVAGTRFCIYRENNRIKSFATCGTLHPLGRLARPFKALVMNKGPISGDDSVLRPALEALARHSKAEGFAFIKASPEVVPGKNPAAENAFAQSGWLPLEGSRITLRLDLKRNDDEIIAGFRKTTRYEIHKAARVGMVVEQAHTEEELEEFLKLYAELSLRKEFHADPIPRLRHIVRWLLHDPHRGTLLLARNRNRILGGAVLVRSGLRCWYIWGAAEKFESASAGHILQWHALLWAKRRGCTEYDFGGYTENNATGPALFKKGFGGEVVHFMAARRKIVNTQRDRILRVLSALRR